MHQLNIRYPNKNDEETRRVYNEINDNWNKYRGLIGEFWSSRLDTRKRQAIIKIVRNNVHQIMKRLWPSDKSIEHLSLNRHFSKLEQRLLANNGQYLWEICQSRYRFYFWQREILLNRRISRLGLSSWQPSIVKTTASMTPIELACCHRFVELSKQALLIVYRYSVDEKSKRQHHQQTNNIDETTIMVVS